MLKSIIESCRYVSTNSKYVKIDKERLESFAKEIIDINMKNWLSSSPFGILELPIDTIINFLLIYESIDFSFWGNPKWTISTEVGELDGGIALLYVLLKYVKENNTTDFSKITKKEFTNLLGGNIEIPLLEQRYNNIKEISQIVNENMNGNFYEYIKAITNDKELFELIINNFPCFKDERTYNNRIIKFYKLAQLLTSDILHIRELKENIKVDYTRLVGCADYKIPQVLRGLGILIYDEELAQLVDNKHELPINSKYEVEIRANQLIVIECLKELLDNKFSSIDINDYLFLQKENKNINLKPYHLTRNTDY